jgi:hypothetical protein
VLLNGRLSRHAAQAFWAAVRDGAVEVVTVGSADLERAWRISADFPDQGQVRLTEDSWRGTRQAKRSGG